MKTFLLIPIYLLFTQSLSAQLYKGENGKVFFSSDAPLELIEATSQELKGALNVSEKTFAFSMPMNTFKGFNSPLQQEHFNENYLESERFPKASFAGKFIEDVDLTQDGSYSLRAKGMLNIHGVKQERIIRSEVIVENGILSIKAVFTVFLEEHDISIPKIMSQKIAEEIYVVIEIDLSITDG